MSGTAWTTHSPHDDSMVRCHPRKSSRTCSFSRPRLVGRAAFHLFLRSSDMSTGSLAGILPTLFRELVHGSVDPAARTYVLNQGDSGLLAALDRLSASAASA